MSDAVSVEFRIVGQGWADIELHVGPHSHTIRAVSDTTDALGDLVRAALVVAAGGYTASASFDGEPVEMRLVLTNFLDTLTGNGSVAVTILSFADIYANEPVEKGHKEFCCDCATIAFGRAVLACAKSREMDFAWGIHPYPLSAIRALELALATRDTLKPP